RAPAPLASDDSVCTPGSMHQNRLDDAIGANRGCQFIELAIVDEDPRLVIVRSQQIDVNLDGAGARSVRRVRDERTQTFAQGRASLDHWLLSVVRAVSCEDRASISFA